MLRGCVWSSHELTHDSTAPDLIYSTPVIWNAIFNAGSLAQSIDVLSKACHYRLLMLHYCHDLPPEPRRREPLEIHPAPSWNLDWTGRNESPSRTWTWVKRNNCSRQSTRQKSSWMNRCCYPSRLLVSCLLLLLDLTLNLLNIMRWTHLSISVWTCLHEVASRIPKSRQIVEQGFIRPLMVTASLTSKIKPEFSKYWVSTCAIWTVLPYSQQCYSLCMLVIFFAYKKCQNSMARALINQFFCPIVSQFHCHLDLKLIQNKCVCQRETRRQRVYAFPSWS